MRRFGDVSNSDRGVAGVAAHHGYHDQGCSLMRNRGLIKAAAVVEAILSAVISLMPADHPETVFTHQQTRSHSSRQAS